MYQQKYQMQYQQSLKTVALCLNPECRCFTRRYSITSNNTVISNTDPNHANCKGWLWGLSQEQVPLKQAVAKSMQKEDFDFLKQPLSSMQSVLDFGVSNWKSGIKDIFLSIRTQISKRIEQVEQKIYNKIQFFLQKTKTVKKNILQLSRNTINKKWGSEHQKFYKEILQNDLRQIQKIGILKVLNFQSLSSQIDKIREIIKRIEWYFWIEQSQFDRIQRFNSSKYEQQLQELLQCRQISAINYKLQDIHSCLKIKNFCFKEKTQNSKNEQISLTCGRCNIQIYPSNDLSAKNKQTKRSQCIMNLYFHFCFYHREEIIDKYIKQSNKVKVRLTLNQVLKQVSSNKYNMCVVIDKENFNYSKEYMKTKDVYVLEVVAKNQQNLTTGRFLVAESSGKDAADILIILVLHQLAKIDPKMRIILVTNDHYGKTLQPICKTLGANIEVRGKISSQIITQMGNQSSQRLINNSIF